MEKIGTIGPGVWQLEEKLLLTMMAMSKNIGIPAGIALLKTECGSLADQQHLLFWFLLPQLCLAGAGVIGLNSELENNASSKYEIYLRPEDNLGAFCARLKRQESYGVNPPEILLKSSCGVTTICWIEVSVLNIFCES